jgi:hypothetical protein
VRTGDVRQRRVELLVVRLGVIPRRHRLVAAVTAAAIVLRLDELSADSCTVISVLYGASGGIMSPNASPWSPHFTLASSLLLSVLVHPAELIRCSVK